MNGFQAKDSNIESTLYLVCLIIISILFFTGCKPTRDYGTAMKNPPSKKTAIYIEAIKPDNNTLLFSYVSYFESKLISYNLMNGEIKIFNTPGIRYCFQPSYSHDGKTIIFSGSNDERDAGNYFTPMNNNFYIINADGTGFRQVSKFQVNKIKLGEPGDVKVCHSATLSPDSKCIIYRCASKQRKKAAPSSGTMFSGWDVYEMDIEKGRERKLSDCDFHEAGRVFYLKGGERFVFSAAMPMKLIIESKGIDKLNFDYKENQIYAMERGHNELNAAFTYGNYNILYGITHSNSMLFESCSNAKDSRPSDLPVCGLFLREQDGRLQKIQNLQRKNDYFAKISPDGSRIVFQKRKDGSIWLINSDGSGLQEIKMPVDKIQNK